MRKINAKNEIKAAQQLLLSCTAKFIVLDAILGEQSIRTAIDKIAATGKIHPLSDQPDYGRLLAVVDNVKQVINTLSDVQGLINAINNFTAGKSGQAWLVSVPKHLPASDYGRAIVTLCLGSVSYPAK